ncbi:efflux RND transporter periplasmic adaptor subunit [Affinirhizobium pseudoryzae]|uniref:efflux RND transporter periplasmic adaptor subunit n=1 Tax=Allorhizobium pseudoryzae TaxID=379684 RepID=UPI0013EC872B|nr:efflux RND transporter periplasmic adaptor subunit [Allorhizobium pseudoryzae]
MKSPIAISFVLIAAGLSACSDDKKDPAPPVRPILSMLAEPRESIATGFAGTVEAQFSTDLGFQVLGRITARHVSVGDLVKKGQILASIDATALQLAVTQAEADLASAVAKLDLAKLNEQRQKTLVASAASTKEQLETAVQSREAAEATVQQLQASLTKAKEQLTYADLTADTDGVVSAVSAEVGQVVSAGQTVLTIARLEARNAVVDIPDSFDQLTKIGTPFEVTLQANPVIKVSGTVRETTPQSDAATRTRRTKIALNAPPASFRLGSTITATPEAPSDGHIWLPESAVGIADGKTFVWVVNTDTKTVSRKTVETRPSAGGGLDVLSGLEPGQRVASAGVYSLADNQTVRIPDEMPQ